MEDLICFYCGKEFKNYKSNQRKFCSRKCFELNRRGFKFPEEWKGKMRGRTPWNKGKHDIYEPEVLEKMRTARLGKPPTNKGISVSKEMCEKISEACRGVKKPNLAKLMKGKIHEKTNHWKGGKTIHCMGYIQIKNRKHPHGDHKGYIFEHRLVMEKILGRYLKPEEVVHHIDGNTANNKPENLMLFANNTEHMRFHSLQKNQEIKGGGINEYLPENC
jgi:hypothetical protein